MKTESSVTFNSNVAQRGYILGGGGRNRQFAKNVWDGAVEEPIAGFGKIK